MLCFDVYYDRPFPEKYTAKDHKLEKGHHYYIKTRHKDLYDNLGLNYRPCPLDKLGWNMNKIVLKLIRKYLLGLSFVDGELQRNNNHSNSAYFLRDCAK